MELTFWSATAVFLGGVVAALALFFMSKGRFTGLDFGAAAVSSVVGAIILTLSYQLTGPVSVGDLFRMFLEGAGVTGIATPIPSAAVKGAKAFASTIRETWKD